MKVFYVALNDVALIGEDSLLPRLFLSSQASSRVRSMPSDKFIDLAHHDSNAGNEY